MDENKLKDIVNIYGKHVIIRTTTDNEYEGVIHMYNEGWIYYVDMDKYQCRLPTSVIEHIKCIDEKFDVEEIMDAERKMYKRQLEELKKMQKENEAESDEPETRTGYQ